MPHPDDHEWSATPTDEMDEGDEGGLQDGHHANDEGESPAANTSQPEQTIQQLQDGNAECARDNAPATSLDEDGSHGLGVEVSTEAGTAPALAPAANASPQGADRDDEEATPAETPAAEQHAQPGGGSSDDAPKQEQVWWRGTVPKTSRFIGVSRYQGKWRSFINVHGRGMELGKFESEVTAAEAYDRWAYYLDRKLNFPEPGSGFTPLSEEELALANPSRPFTSTDGRDKRLRDPASCKRPERMADLSFGGSLHMPPAKRARRAAAEGGEEQESVAGTGRGPAEAVSGAPEVITIDGGDDGDGAEQTSRARAARGARPKAKQPSPSPPQRAPPTSKYNGVSKSGGMARPWQARIQNESLGAFDSELEAAKAYDAAASLPRRRVLFACKLNRDKFPEDFDHQREARRPDSRTMHTPAVPPPQTDAQAPAAPADATLHAGDAPMFSAPRPAAADEVQCPVGGATTTMPNANTAQPPHTATAAPQTDDTPPPAAAPPAMPPTASEAPAAGASAAPNSTAQAASSRAAPTPAAPSAGDGRGANVNVDAAKTPAETLVAGMTLINDMAHQDPSLRDLVRPVIEQLLAQK